MYFSDNETFFHVSVPPPVFPFAPPFRLTVDSPEVMSKASTSLQSPQETGVVELLVETRGSKVALAKQKWVGGRNIRI